MYFNFYMDNIFTINNYIFIIEVFVFSIGCTFLFFPMVSLFLLFKFFNFTEEY